MKVSDIVEAAMQPAFDQQAKDAARIRKRKARQATSMLVASTALSSGYATSMAMRYFETGSFEPISLVVLAVFVVVTGDRWRALDASNNASKA